MGELIRDTDKVFCSILLDVLEEYGVKEVVCSPGSRNTPLLIAASARKAFHCSVVIDERSAAFMALGLSSVGRQPVALICTSGTALLNYGPAVAEAYYQSVPLVVISADRPEQWIDQDDSQTLRQFEALSNYVKRSYQIPAWGNDDPELQWYVNRIANDAMIEATSHRPGPVHINVRLGDPLGHKIEKERTLPRVIRMVSSDIVADREWIRSLARHLAGARVMFVAGFMLPDNKLHRSVEEFCRLPNVVAMCETLSNLNIGRHSTAVDTVLTAFTDETLDDMAPDVVISVGGSLVSRKLKEYLRRNSSRCEHWSIGWQHTTSDCFMSLTRRIEVSPSRFLHQLAAATKKIMDSATGTPVREYGEIWYGMRCEAVSRKWEFAKSAGWSELYALKTIFDALPSSANLFLSNGTVVRYAQILTGRLPHASYCNRGVSGIDGSVSTAFGGAREYKGMTVVVTGDMSMTYDVGSLALSCIPDRVRLIVIDNNGGGIFRFIPTTSGLEEREKFFCARPSLPLRDLARGYGWEYLEADNVDALDETLKTLFSPGAKKMLRIVCEGEKSAELLKEYMRIKC